jgi:hypothetical protein
MIHFCSKTFNEKVPMDAKAQESRDWPTALERLWKRALPNKITGANAGELRQLVVRTNSAARVAQFWH